MFRPVPQYLRVFGVVALCSMLAGCAHETTCPRAAEDGKKNLWCYPEEWGDMGCHQFPHFPICPPGATIVGCYLFGVEFDDHDRTVLSAITVEEKIELRRALKDTLALPLDELRKKRYNPYLVNHPDQRWTAAEIIGKSFDSNVLISGYGLVGFSTTGFEASLKLPASVPALEKALKRVEEEIDNCGKKWECIRY